MAVVITSNASRNDRGRVLIFFVLTLATLLFVIGIGVIIYALLSKLEQPWVWVGLGTAGLGILAYVFGGMMFYGYKRVPHYNGHILTRNSDAQGSRKHDHHHHDKKHKCCGKSGRGGQDDYGRDGLRSRGQDDRDDYGRDGRARSGRDYFQQPVVQISSENVQVVDSLGPGEDDDSITGNSDMNLPVMVRSPSATGQAYASYESI